MNTNRFFISAVFIMLIIGISIRAQKKRYAAPMEHLIKKQVEIYPELEVQDLYKLLHQAAMGSEHAVKDTSSARNWMENEISNLDWNHEDALVDTISPGGKIVRVNLRPYLKAGYDPGKLLAAFIETANVYRGSTDTLQSYLTLALKMIDSGELKLSKEEAQNFFYEMKQKGYPAVHHSKKYEELYSPAYRVVAEKYISFLKPKN